MYTNADEIDSECNSQNGSVILQQEFRKSASTQFPREVELCFATKSESVSQRKNFYLVPSGEPIPEDIAAHSKHSIDECRLAHTDTIRNKQPKQPLPKAKLFRQLLCIDCC